MMGDSSFYEDWTAMNPQTVFDSIPCGLCVYRIDGGRIVPLFHNHAFFEILGYSEEHIARIKENEVGFIGVHPEDDGPLREMVSGLIHKGGILRHTLRVYNDREKEYHWIRLEGSMRQEGGARFLYGVYSDISGQVRLEKELAEAKEKTEDIINAIPGGVAVYKVSGRFETIYFSDGVPELTGYTVEEYRSLIKKDAAEMTYREDTSMVVSRAMEVVKTHEPAEFEFRKQHRDGHIVWVRIQITWIGEEDGCPLLHCVFHNISDLKEARLEMEHLVNSIPGGIAIYQAEREGFKATFLSDGVIALSGHSREDYEYLIRNDALDIVYAADRKRVTAFVNKTMKDGDVLDVSYRIRHKDGRLVWIHMSGQRMEAPAEKPKIYIVLTGMSAQARLFQSIANETADAIYVIDKENYDLLYINESKNLFTKGRNCVGQKCYEALHGKSAPCSFCTLKTHAPDGEEHEMKVDGSGRFYTTRFKENDWNGIPAYVKYIRDVTKEVRANQEKERLEEYFQTVVKYLPGGIAVVRCEKDGTLVPEFISEGFAAMTSMTMEETWRMCGEDAMADVHPGDLARVNREMAEHIVNGEQRFEMVYRLITGNGSYIWIRNTLSLIRSEGGESRFYAVYHDITKEREEQEQLRRQFRERLMQHYGTTDPNALVMGHCNITQNRILEISDHTDSGLLETFGFVREEFFTGLSSLVVDENERKEFLSMYLNAPALEAFERNDTERILRCFIKLPKEPKGRYVQFKVNLVDAPDTGDVTGILTVTDITEQTIADRILHQLSVTSYDFVIDLNLGQDTYTMLTCNRESGCLPKHLGSHAARIAHMLESVIVPKDRDTFQKAMDPDRMRRRLEEQGAYTFAFSIVDGNGDIRTKNMTVSAVDLRLDRVCLVRSDITDSVREQQGLLNIMAYTFELVGFINIYSRSLTMYTRRTILENLSPYEMDDYEEAVGRFISRYDAEGAGEEAKCQFSLETILRQLSQKPSGYDFVFPYHDDNGKRYKQVNVLWGDSNHRTVCLVRGDVTDMLSEERRTKDALEKALELAREASRAKSDFLSNMSHDIRTPMNAIMGMTTLAYAHLDERERVGDCLQKISVSSGHLLSLINDILDMSKIEQSKITLNHMRISVTGLIEQISAIMAPQAKAAGLVFSISTRDIRHGYFYGDRLRINQILLNLLSNAVKFTPRGGTVEFLAEELEWSGKPGKTNYLFTVRDTGMGMSEEFLSHIFEPFTRITSRIEGTGLGLSITKGLVDLMGGCITVESREGHGSVFRVELECEYTDGGEEACAAEHRMSVTAPERQFAGRRFLIAEDNDINAEILSELLKMSGAESVLKTDGIQAVEAFRDTPPGTFDAILMDIRMPGLNGYEATGVIRRMEREDAGRIPIVAMTANAFSEDVQAAMEAGMDAHVAKPIDIDVLKTTLTRVLDNVNKE